MKTLINLLSWLLGVSFNALIFIVLAFAVFFVARQAFFAGYDFSDRITAYRGSEVVEFVLERDMSPEEVAVLLEEQGLIESALLYRIELFLIGANRDFSAGTFRLSPDMSGTRINAVLRASPVEPEGDPNRFMLREGRTVRDLALYLDEVREFFPAEDFLYMVENHDFGFAFLENIPERPPLLVGGTERPPRLEGYLFPDTYFVSSNPTPLEVITIMLNQFNQVFNFEWRMRAEELGLTMDEIVIIASMIEREVRVPEERAMVSRVIHNRLAQGMRLQIDATVHYALDIHLDRTLIEHTQVASPYNTYWASGLPAGPIGNPGRASIEAALYPADGNWLFYVLVDRETGAHFFTHDYQEHLHAVEHYMPRPWED